MASTSNPSGSGYDDPTENLKKEPSKGILKPSVSYEEKEWVNLSVIDNCYCYYVIMNCGKKSLEKKSEA